MSRRNKILIPFMTVLTACLPGHAGAQPRIPHFEIQAGCEYMYEMSRKPGVAVDVGGRIGITDKYYAAASLHAGINNGYYTVEDDGEQMQREDNLREYMLGIGPGVYLYSEGDRWINAELLMGYGFGERTSQKIAENDRPLNGFAAAFRIGTEFAMSNGLIWGLNTAAYCIGKKIHPAINLKIGFFLDL